MQYYTAIRAKADCIITRNQKNFATSKLPVMSAGEYLNTLCIRRNALLHYSQLADNHPLRKA